MKRATACLIMLASLSWVFGCSQEAEPMCVPGEQICNAEGTASFVCADGSWEMEQSCTGRSESCGIVDGDAACFCEDGVRDCSSEGRTVVVCSGGAWVQEETCSEQDVCNYDGEADEVLCMPADTACDPTRDRERCRVVASVGDPGSKYTADAYTCAPNGRWVLKTTCAEAEVCIMRLPDAATAKADPTLKEVAVCEPFPCQEGVEYCPAGSATGNPHVCEDGKLVKKEDCSADTACVIAPSGQAVCVDFWDPCTPGSEWCGSNGRAYRCSDDQEAVVKPGCSGHVACQIVDGIASCVPSCTPGEQQCSSSKVAQVCGDDRKWYDSTLCSDNEECVVFEGTAACRPVSPL